LLEVRAKRESDLVPRRICSGARKNEVIDFARRRIRCPDHVARACSESPQLEYRLGSSKIFDFVVVRRPAERRLPAEPWRRDWNSAQQKLDAGVLDRPGIERLGTRHSDRWCDLLVENRVDGALVIVRHFGAEPVVECAEVESELDLLAALRTEIG